MLKIRKNTIKFWMVALRSHLWRFAVAYIVGLVALTLLEYSGNTLEIVGLGAILHGFYKYLRESYFVYVFYAQKRDKELLKAVERITKMIEDRKKRQQNKDK